MILDISYFFNRQPNPESVNADRSLFKLVFNQLYLRPFWSEFQPLKGHPLSLIEVIAIAIALAMDAFAVAVAIGVILRRVTTRQTFRLSWHFGLFQAMMPVIGWWVGLSVQHLIASFDHWVVFALLFLIGGRMILSAVTGEEEVAESRDPTTSWSLVMLSVATSVDALAVGLSLAILRISVWFPALVIGSIAFVITAAGIQIGGILGRRLGIARYAALFGGGVLISIGGKILYEHGAF